VRIIVLAGRPTDSVTYGFLPAAARLGLEVVLLTDQPARHAAAYADLDAAPREIHRCEVFDVRAVLDWVGRQPRPAAVFTNSDHLQTHAALAAAYHGLPGKDWRATARTKNKALMRRHLAGLGIDTVRCATIGPADPVEEVAARLPYPCVLKPAEGVAGEDVRLVAHPAELTALVAATRGRRPGQPLLAEEYLEGPLHTLETLGSASGIRVLGGWRTELSPPPYFVERRMSWLPDVPEPVRAGVLAQLAALGVGLGACHTEFVLQGERARLIEVNYRIIGDDGDLLMAQLLEEPLFELVLRAHLGEDVVALAPGTPRRWHGLLEWAVAERGGMLVAAPGPVETEQVVYRPLRSVGDRITLTHSNRDYLGVLRVRGPDQDTVDAAAAGFWAGRRWEIAP
jgi:biotin carboxylase